MKIKTILLFDNDLCFFIGSTKAMISGKFLWPYGYIHIIGMILDVWKKR